MLRNEGGGPVANGAAGDQYSVMPSRTIAIGDIHGCATALAALIASIDPGRDDTVVTLGDYVDRGPDSRGVLDQLLALEARCRLIAILGNHEELMLAAADGRMMVEFWRNCGGNATLDSYGVPGSIEAADLPALIPAAHRRFLERCRTHFETDTHFFVHANYQPDVPLDRQGPETLRWLSLRDVVPGPHCSGKIAVVGHTPQPDVLNLGHLICIDTGCCTGGRLTALEVTSGHVWQAAERRPGLIEGSLGSPQQPMHRRDTSPKR